MEKLSNNQIAWRAAQDIADGAYVNLGIGFPKRSPSFSQRDARRSFTPRTDFSVSARPRSLVRRTGT